MTTHRITTALAVLVSMCALEPSVQAIQMINLVGGTYSASEFYVGYEVKLDSPSGITQHTEVFTFDRDVTIESLSGTYTCHEGLATIAGKPKLMPCGLMLFYVHDGASMVGAPIVVYGNTSSEAFQFPVRRRVLRTLYLVIQSYQYGVFEVQMTGVGP